MKGSATVKTLVDLSLITYCSLFVDVSLGKVRTMHKTIMKPERDENIL